VEIRRKSSTPVLAGYQQKDTPCTRDAGQLIALG
jgi:hypothetical protein